MTCWGTKGGRCEESSLSAGANVVSTGFRGSPQASDYGKHEVLHRTRQSRGTLVYLCLVPELIELSSQSLELAIQVRWAKLTCGQAPPGLALVHLCLSSEPDAFPQNLIPFRHGISGVLMGCNSYVMC